MKLLQSLLYAGLLAAIFNVRSVSAETLTVAVLDFTANQHPTLPKDVTALVTANLSTDTNFVLVERAQLQKALGEQALGRSGNIDASEAAKVGQLTGAKVLVTGRAIRLEKQMLIVANIIGTETGRVYSEKVQGPATNMMNLTASLAQKIAATITAQSTNFFSKPLLSRDELIAAIVEKVKDKRHPSVSFQIRERVAGERGQHTTVQNELGVIFQKAGFEVVDNKSDHRPDVVVTGDAVVDGVAKNDGMFSSRAMIDILAKDRVTGKTISIDHEEKATADVGRQTASRLALESAADVLADRLVPAIAQ